MIADLDEAYKRRNKAGQLSFLANGRVVVPIWDAAIPLVLRVMKGHPTSSNLVSMP